MSATAGAQIASLSLQPAVHAGSETSLQQAASLMRTENISSLVIDTHPPSLLTERDLVRAVAEGFESTDEVTSVATRAPVWVPSTLSVLNAAAIMARYELRHLVVLAPTGEPVGVLSIRQALAVLLDAVDPAGWLTAFPSLAGMWGERSCAAPCQSSRQTVTLGPASSL